MSRLLHGSLIAAALCLGAALAQAADAPATATTAPAAAAPARGVTQPAKPVGATEKPAAATAGKPGAKTTDKIDLDTTQITGNKELPKVMYVVPWKRSDMGDFGGRPAKSLLDEALAPVDRDVFRRQTRYYNALQPDAAAAPAAGAGNEK